MERTIDLVTLTTQHGVLNDIASEHCLTEAIRGMGLGFCPYLVVNWETFSKAFGPDTDDSIRVRVNELDDCRYHTARFTIDGEIYEINASEPKEE
jgi:hypothetical protein